MQMLTCVRPWEFVQHIGSRIASNVTPDPKTRAESSRTALKKQATSSALPLLPLPEAQPCMARAAKGKHWHWFGATQVRHLVSERGRDVLLHNEPVAQGQFGRVYVGLAEDAGSGGAQVRLFKKLRLEPATFHPQVQSTDLKDLATEIATAQRAGSAMAPNHVLVTRSHKARYKAYLELPVMRGTLRQLVHEANDDGRRLLVRAVLADGLAQMAQAHTHGVIHRDIKPDNIFFDDTGLVLGDWGLGCYTTDADALRHGAGTPGFAAPEVLDNKVGRRGPAMDLWSLGATVLQIALGVNEPWRRAYRRAYDEAMDRGASHSEAMDAAVDCQLQTHQDYRAWFQRRDAAIETLPPEQARFAEAFARMDPSLRDLLWRLMAPNPDDRGTAAEHLAYVQQKLPISADDTARLRDFYAAQQGMRTAVEQRLHDLERARK